MTPKYCCCGIVCHVIKPVTRTEAIWLRPNEKLSTLCHISKNIFNQANYIIKNAEPRKWIRYCALNAALKDGPDSVNYRALPIQSAQQTLKLIDKAWKSFFNAHKEWKKYPDKFEKEPNPPRYKKKNGEHILVFTNQQCKLNNGVLSFPKMVELEVKTRLPDDTNIREIRILPRGVGYVCEIVYLKDVFVDEINKDRMASIDFGSKNIITMMNNIGLKPIAVKDDGTAIKSINQFYNKKKAELQRVYDNQGIKWKGDKMRRLERKRTNKANNYIHKLSRYIVDWCVKHNIGTLVFGYNEGWKQEVELGRRNNQTFVQIPYMSIIEKTAYKAEEVGLKIEKQEESHTSKCSFLDKEPVEHHDKYMGKRINRGLFRSAKGLIINADVNGAGNIMVKSDPKAFTKVDADGIGGCALHPVLVRISNKHEGELSNV